MCVNVCRKFLNFNEQFHFMQNKSSLEPLEVTSHSVYTTEQYIAG